MNFSRNKSRNKKRVIMWGLCILCVCFLTVVFTADPGFAAAKSVQKTQVKGLQARSIDGDTIRLYWDSVSGAQGYIIYASKLRHGRYYEVDRIRSSRAASADISGCITGKTYYFRVQAFAGNVTGRKSAAVAGKAVDAKAGKAKAGASGQEAAAFETNKGISAVKNPEAAPSVKGASAKPNAPRIAVSTVGSTELKVNITNVSKAKGYAIYRSVKKSGGFKQVTMVKASSATKTKYTDIGLKSSKKYYYKVKAYRESGGTKTYSSFSAVEYARTKAKPNGNSAKYDVSKVKYVATDLNGRTAYFLGSSITQGMKAGNQSFVDFLKKKYKMKVKKYAVNGTTLVGMPYDSGSNSYISRMTNDMENLPAPDYFVCQLSTNDAMPKSGPSPLGKIESNKYQLADFNTNTVAGAIEYITRYAWDTWDCPAVFYVTKTRDDWPYNEQYSKMIEKLYAAEAKWNKKRPGQLQIIDLSTNSKAKFKNTDDMLLCMFDAVHPTKAGYLKKFVPVFKNFFLNIYRAVTSDPLTTTEDPVVDLTLQEPEQQTESLPEETFPAQEDTIVTDEGNDGQNEPGQQAVDDEA